MPVLLPCHSSYGNHLLADDLKQVPAVTAAFVYNAATRIKITREAAVSGT